MSYTVDSHSMGHNTSQSMEQKMRTRDEQAKALSADFFDDGSDEAGAFDMALGHIVEAEARGAAEQRRKDAEGCIPVHQYFMGGVWNDCSPEMYASQSYRRILYTRPANVAVLEARVEELEGMLIKILASGSEYFSALRHTECVDIASAHKPKPYV